MTKVNLINKNLIVGQTNISNGVDESKINPVISAVQQLYLRPILGKNLYEAVLTHEKAFIDNGTAIPEPYATLLEDYICEFLINMTAVDLIPLLAVTVSNGGVFIHSSDNANEASIEEMNLIIDKYESRAKIAEMLLNEYLEEHKDDFTEYDTEEDWEQEPKESVRTRGGWYGL